MDNLSTIDLASIEELANKINLFNSKQIAQYGIDIQNKISSLPDLFLNDYKNVSTQEASDFIIKLLDMLRQFDIPYTVLQKPLEHKKELSKLQKDYKNISSLLAKLQNALDEQELILMDNASAFSKFEEKVKRYNYKLTIFIEADKKKLSDAKNIQNSITQKSLSKSFNELTIANASKRLSDRIDSLGRSQSIISLFCSHLLISMKSNKEALNGIRKISRNVIPAWKKKIEIALNLSCMVDSISSTYDVSESNEDLIKKVKSLNKNLNYDASMFKIEELRLLSLKVNRVEK